MLKANPRGMDHREWYMLFRQPSAISSTFTAQAMYCTVVTQNEAVTGSSCSISTSPTLTTPPSNCFWATRMWERKNIRIPKSLFDLSDCQTNTILASSIQDRRQNRQALHWIHPCKGSKPSTMKSSAPTELIYRQSGMHRAVPAQGKESQVLASI